MCSGEQPFFRPTGHNRPLNWVWFGALGGFIGWLLFAVVDWFTRNGWGGLGRYAERLMRQVSEGASAESLVEDSLIGACFGSGLILLLSIMEERTQPDMFNYQRIALRTIIGALLSLMVFGLGFLLQASWPDRLPAPVGRIDLDGVRPVPGSGADGQLQHHGTPAA